MDRQGGAASGRCAHCSRGCPSLVMMDSIYSAELVPGPALASVEDQVHWRASNVRAVMTRSAWPANQQSGCLQLWFSLRARQGLPVSRPTYTIIILQSFAQSMAPHV